jgi:hypothetical protein
MDLSRKAKASAYLQTKKLKRLKKKFSFWVSNVLMTGISGQIISLGLMVSTTIFNLFLLSSGAHFGLIIVANIVLAAISYPILVNGFRQLYEMIGYWAYIPYGICWLVLVQHSIMMVQLIPACALVVLLVDDIKVMYFHAEPLFFDITSYYFATRV